MTLTRNKHRWKYWLLCGVFALSTLVGAVPLQVSAAPSGAGAEYFKDRADRYYAARYLRDCMNQYKPWNVALNADGSLYAGLTHYGRNDGEKGVDIGRYYSPINNAYSLNTAGWIKCANGGDSSQIVKSINDFGYSTPREFLIALGYMQETPEEIQVGANRVTITRYTINQYKTVENNLNKIIDAADMRRTPTDEFFIYDTILPEVCEFSTTISGNGKKATFTNIVRDSSGNYSSQDIDIEFPVTSRASTTGTSGQTSTSTTSEADKLIKAYDYGGRGEANTQNITCADLLSARNKLVSAVIEYNKTNPDRAIETTVGRGDATLGNGDTACTAGALGWVLCPLSVMFQNMITGLAENIDKIMRIEPLLNTDSGAAIQQVWSLFVGFANLLLVLAFLVVIFSQATSLGLSAYGIKKMLPRIIAAAILINLSFYICALAVDLTNIIGGSVKGIISGVITSIPKDQIPMENWDAAEQFGSWILFTTILLAGAAALVTNFMMILPVLFMGAVSVFFVFIALAIRQVLVYTLIFVAPLAFAAMILPNTEQLFAKWRKLFMNMLILYPVIMFVLHGSNLVGGIILMAKGGQESLPMDIIAFIVMTVGPFAGLYIYLKNSNKIMSMAAGMISKAGNAPRKAIEDWSRGQQQNMNNRRLTWLQNKADTKNTSPSRSARLARFGMRVDPGMMKVRQGAIASQYDEAAKIASARVANEYIGKKYGENSIQGARAQAALGELDMKQAQMQLEYIHNNNGREAFNEGKRTGSQALMNIAASRMVSTAKLEDLQTEMQGLDSNVIASISRHIADKNFTEMKTQDLGMLYAIEDLQNDTTAANALQDLVTGSNTMGKAPGKRYYEKAAKASKSARAMQEVFSLKKTIPHMQPYEAAAIIADKNIMSSIKGDQEAEIRKLAAEATSLNFQIPAQLGGTKAAAPADIIAQINGNPKGWGAFSDKDIMRSIKLADAAAAAAAAGSPASMQASALKTAAEAEARNRSLIT